MNRLTIRTHVAAIFLAIGAIAALGVGGRDAPLMKVLHMFTAPDVPEMAASETVVDALKWDQPIPAGLPGRGLAQHPMLVLGEGYNKLLIVNKGKIVWTYSTGPGWEYDDAWMLSNGNVLFTRMQYIAEVTPNKKIVWRYDAPAGTEIHCCQPIGEDKVLFIVNGEPPKLMVVNTKSNQTEVEHELPFDPKRGVHAQFRRVRYTAQGTYLVPFLTMNRVVEYDKDFKEIWSQEIKSPWAAIRLKNGNTLITDEQDALTTELDPLGRTVWSLKDTELPERYRYGNTQSCTRLANGNTIICSRGGKNHGPQFVEVTRAKKVVWVLQDWAQVGPGTAIQVLDEPGVPERPGDVTR